MRSSSSKRSSYNFQSHSSHRVLSGKMNINEVIPAAPITSNRESLLNARSLGFNPINSINMKGVNQELNGNIGIVLPQVVKLGHDSMILDSNLPIDLKLIESADNTMDRDQIYNNYGCIIPISEEMGRKLDGRRIRYAEGLPLHQDKDRLINKLKENPENKKLVDQLKAKLGKCDQIGVIGSYLYVSDEDDYIHQDHAVNYEALLLLKADEIQKLEAVIKNYQSKLRSGGRIDSYGNPQSSIMDRRMFHKMSESLKTMMAKHPKQSSMMDKNMISFMGQTSAFSDVQTMMGEDLKKLIASHEELYDDLHPDVKLFLSGQFLNQIETIVGSIATMGSATLESILRLDLVRIVSRYPALYAGLSASTQLYLSEYNGGLAVSEGQAVLHSGSISTHQVRTLKDIETVGIVQYVPQVVKVENVYQYAHSVEKSKRIELHLRVLVKTLLEELERMRVQTGAILEIDEAVIEMIRNQIFEIVDTNDILKVFQVVPKLVEVERVIERVVEHFVQIPKIRDVTITKEVPVQVTKIQPFENIVHKPIKDVEIVTLKHEILAVVKDIVQEVLAVPRRIEIPVEIIREVAKIDVIEIPVDRIIEREVVMPLPERIIDKQIIVEMPVEIIREVLPPNKPENYKEVMREIPVYNDKIIEVVHEVLKPYEVTRFVPQVEVKIEKEIRHVIQNEIIIEKEFIEKPFPVERTIEIPREITKTIIVPEYLKQQIPKIVETQLIVEKPIIRQVIKVVQIDKPVTMIHEVIREQKAIVENFAFKEVIHPVDRIIEVPVHHHTENIINKPVYIDKPVILYQNEIIEIQNIINHEVIREKPINITEEKIVEIREYIDRIKPIHLVTEKIIEKIVEVPKVVEIERIVERIQIVPRVIDRIVRVPQIIEVPVEKIVEKVVIQVVDRIIQVPVIEERIIQVEVPRTVIQKLEVPVEVTIPLPIETIIRENTVEIKEIFVDRIIPERVEVLRDRIVERIVPYLQQVPKFIERPEIVPVLIEKEVPMIRQKAIIIPIKQQVPIEIIRIIKQQVPMVQKVVELREVTSIVERVILQDRVKVVEDRVIVIQPQYKELHIQVPFEVIHEKVMPVDKCLERIVEVEHKIYEHVPVEVIVEKPIYIEKAVELTKIIPRIVEIPKIIEVITNQFREIPILYEKLKEIRTIEEKLIPVQSVSQELVEQQVKIEKELIITKLEKVVDRVVMIEQAIDVVEATIHKDVPIVVYKDRVQEMPVIIEQLMEKVIMMPQVVEVLKYVHDVMEKDYLGPAVEGDLGQEQYQLNILSTKLRQQTDILIKDMSFMESDSRYRDQAEKMKKFLVDLMLFLEAPKIHEVIIEKTSDRFISKDRFVQLPSESGDAFGKNYLIESLIRELKRLQSGKANLQLSPDIMGLFFSGDVSGDRDLSQKLRRYAQSVEETFRIKGSWNREQQELLSTFLEERYSILDEMRKVKKDLKELDITKAHLHKVKKEKEQMKRERDQLIEWVKFMPDLIKDRKMWELDRIFEEHSSKYLRGTGKAFSQVTNLVQSKTDSADNSVLINQLTSQIHEKTSEIDRLRIIESDHRNCGRKSASSHSSQDSLIKRLQTEIERLKILEREHSQCPIHEEAQIRIWKEKYNSLEREIEEMKHKFKGSTTIASPTSQYYSPRAERNQNTDSDHSEYGRHYENYVLASDGDIGMTHSREESETRIVHKEIRRSYIQESSSGIEQSSKVIQSISPDSRNVVNDGDQKNLLQEGYRYQSSSSQQRYIPSNYTRIQESGKSGSSASGISGGQSRVDTEGLNIHQTTYKRTYRK